MVARNMFVFLIFALGCFRMLRFAESLLPPEEVDALQQIVTVLGSKYWKFNPDTCEVEAVGLTPAPPNDSETEIKCECHFENNTVCHVVKIVLKHYNLPGKLPSQMVKLPYLGEIDLAYNYLHGSLPPEWASMQLENISILVNRLSGEIPKEWGNMTSLQYLSLESNQISGAIPPEIGDLINLKTLILSSNKLTGKLPERLARLQNLTDLRINDNQFNGTIPSFIQNLTQLTRLEMQASGLKGPIPSAISVLNNLSDLRISDISGPDQLFPEVRNMSGLTKLVLRNCNILGMLSTDIWMMENLETLDVSFNQLVGEIPKVIPGDRLRFVFLTGNMLSGDIPDSILKDGTTVDLSYNNFTLQGPDQNPCQKNMNMNLNLFRSSSARNDLRGQLPCMKDFKCPRYSTCLNVNCGGNDITAKQIKRKLFYQGDGDVEGGSAKYYMNPDGYWGFSSTGDFMDDFDSQNKRLTVSTPLSNQVDLYSTARISPTSLTYFHYCLENGFYNVNLHFAEIQFTNDRMSNGLGRRAFDIYVQEKLVKKDFDIVEEAKGAQKPVTERFDVNVTNNYLAIRFYWAGKGTTRIPRRSFYGPLVSAISVVSDSKPCSHGESNKNAWIAIGVGVPCVILLMLGILWWRGCPPKQCMIRQATKGQDLPAGTFTLKQIEAATNNFDPDNKIGEGGFGPVYKGELSDGRVIAVKQLSSRSRQGNREFLNEIGIISCVHHPNLVKLHGFCVEGDHLMLVYEYMENNSLARALFGPEKYQLKLDWPTRLKICIGIARGLVFLHEDSVLKIVHRDIKATNVLLDRDLNPKIADFGLARLNEAEKTHISTRVAGTIGYIAPEYALWGHLAFKADVYSFGVLALEVISGKNNNSFIPSEQFVCLLDWACHCHRAGDLTALVDERVRSEVKKEESEVVIKVALLCTNAAASLRPTMSEVVGMLEGRMPIPDAIPETYSEDLRFKVMRDLRRDKENRSYSGSQTQNSTSVNTFGFSQLNTFGFSQLNTFGFSQLSVESTDVIKPETKSC